MYLEKGLKVQSLVLNLPLGTKQESTPQEKVRNLWTIQSWGGQVVTEEQATPSRRDSENGPENCEERGTVNEDNMSPKSS